MFTIKDNEKEYVQIRNISACNYCKLGNDESEVAVKACFDFHETHCGIPEKFENITPILSDERRCN